MKNKLENNKKEGSDEVVFLINEPVGSYHQPVGSYHQPVGSYHQPVGSYRQPVGSYRQPVGSYRQPVGSYRQPVGSYRQPLGSEKLFTGQKKLIIAPIIVLTSLTDTDFIPAPNAEFDNWQKNFVIKVNSFITGWAIGTDGTDEWVVIQGLANVKQARWTEAWAIVSSKQFTHSDEVEMLAARKAYESGDKTNPLDTSLRIWITRYVRNNKHVTDEQKSQCGLTVSKGTITATNADTVKAITDAQIVLSIKETGHLLHVVKATQNKKSLAKDKDVLENSMYISFTPGTVTVAPDISLFTYDGAILRGLYPREFTAPQEGLRAWYIARKKYKGKAKKIGTPSVAISAIVG